MEEGQATLASELLPDQRDDRRATRGPGRDRLNGRYSIVQNLPLVWMAASVEIEMYLLLGMSRLELRGCLMALSACNLIWMSTMGWESS